MKDGSGGISGSASVRLRRKREERARERRSVEYREDLDTLDHTENTEVKNNLRQALRSKYKIQDDSITIKHFGYIDQPQPSIEVLHKCAQYFISWYLHYENYDSLTDIWRWLKKRVFSFATRKNYDINNLNFSPGGKQIGCNSQWNIASSRTRLRNPYSPGWLISTDDAEIVQQEH